MNSQNYVSQLKNRMELYYDLIQGSKLCDMVNADMYQRLRMIGSKHMISKKIVLWSMGEFEHCFIRLAKEELTWHEVETMIDGLERIRDMVVEPGPDHKRTVIRGVLVTEDDPCKISKQVRKYKSEVNYKMMLHGWSEISIVIVNPSAGVIVHNSRKAQDIKYVNELFGVKEK